MVRLGLDDDPRGVAVAQDAPDEVAAVLTQASWLESKVSAGGTALDRVREQHHAARAELEPA